ncbi:MAG: 3'-5' exonuclease [Sulfurospirillum sp.]|nr:3'-5' exonuclease [Sulfurospirillum sp.]MBL0702384.1 3'-5' exonuclease [Sulfurospirillum sp.]
MKKEPQSFCECREIFKNTRELGNYDFNFLNKSVENMKALGLPLVELSNKKLALETTFTLLENQKFCIVDIETNGSKPENSQIIEIGALMVQNGKVIDTFETLVKADEIPENIIYLTKITLEDLKNATSLKISLKQFRLFLKDAIFVAHNVSFDYNFISYSMKKAGFAPLLNRKICSIDLAKKTIKLEKYGLAHLIKEFGIEVKQHHRAYSDAYATNIVFQKCLKKLPEFVITTENLIKFTKENSKKSKINNPKPLANSIKKNS